MDSRHGDYEQQQIRAIEEWEDRPPSHLARAVGFFSAPLTWAAKQVVPEPTMEQALNAAFTAASAVSGSDDLLQEAKALGFTATAVTDFRDAPLHVSDCLVASVTRWAKGLAGAEGAVTGMTGILGLTADIPALIILAIRTIRKIGYCYGFDTARDEERPFVLHCLSAGAANGVEEKKAAIAAAMELRNVLDQPAETALKKTESEILSREAFAAAVRNLAKQLCINLARRKAAQVIPVVGGGIGAAMNVLFITDVAEAAHRLYQKRRLECQTIDATRAPVAQR
ncbi:MAG: hypothetical protein OZSIB_3865 [Candidatus Ozemobacter sibiricus]|jgi:acyl-CoA synthetase (AMP-forming)/AMP-acid ligase II|uniref:STAPHYLOLYTIC protease PREPROENZYME LASA n=1 Tax=Candidatus Ozemobacter sibiricus TaxID=2268124 RepID=A0A367ZPM6_9BACT|nr:MAG: hypothetical protein OZSIB_3865 [Candidatus Ozemobacter sibiricus]